MASSSITLHVGASSRQVTSDVLKVLVGAEAGGVSLEAVAADVSMIPFKRPVALQVDETFLFSANESARFLTGNPSGSLTKKGKVAAPLLVDEWMAWEETQLQPLLPPLTNAVASGSVTFPIAAHVANEGVMVADELSSGMALFAARAHATGAGAGAGAGAGGKASKSGKAIPSTVLDAYRGVSSRLQQLGAALGKSDGPFLLGSTPVIADAIIVADLTQLLPLYPESGFGAVRAYAAAVEALPVFAKARAQLPATLKACTTSMDGLAMNSSIHSDLEAIFSAAISKAFPGHESDPRIVANSSSRPHHYQCDASMGMFKKLKSAGVAVRSPLAVAEAIVEATGSHPMLHKMETVPQGFINIYLNPKYLGARLMHILGKGRMDPPACAPRKVAIDYSSPNIAKDMHVGHLRSTIIGDALARIIEFCGHEVLRINHVGDWGTQFGMLIAHLKDRFPDYKTTMPNIQDLTQLYKDAKKRFDEEEDFKGRAHEEVVKLQAGDELNLNMWKRIVDVSASMFGEVYNRLGIDSRLTLCGESFYNPMAPGVIAELEKKGLTQPNEGALVLFPSKATAKHPLMVRKSDGGIGYDTTDLAAIQYRIQQLKCDWLVYVVDSGQGDHFQLVFAGADDAGWIPEGTRVEHVAFGVVQGEDRKKFKTRAGTTVRLVDLLDRARDLMKEALLARHAEGASNVPLSEIDDVAAKLGYSAVKYFDLRQNRLTDYVFSYDAMLSRDGDTAVYLQYAYVRLNSILRKAEAELGVSISALKASGHAIDVSHPAELVLAAEMARFQDMLVQVQQDLLSHRLCSYMRTVSVKFSEFVSKCRVIGSPEQNSRLLLVETVRVALFTCFTLLGFEPCDRL